MTTSSKNIVPGKIISKRFVISKKIGEGSFGCVYQGYDIQKGIDVAIKIEEFSKNDERIKKESLHKEARFLYDLKENWGIPRMFYFVKTETKRILVMSLLGINLEVMFQNQMRRFCLKTVLSLAEQMLNRLEQIHSKDIIHRDLKPENFLLSNETNDDLIYLVDFGLSKKFRTKGEHIGFKSGFGLVGTARYASLNAHMGNDQSRRDDLESLGYILVYFLKGHLPWMNLHANTKEEKHKLIILKKKKTSFQKLCQGLPFEFEQYLIYVRNLKYEEDPNYNFLKTLFKRVASRNHYENGYEWNINYNDRFSENHISKKEIETSLLDQKSSNPEGKLLYKDKRNALKNSHTNSFQNSVKFQNSSILEKKFKIFRRKNIVVLIPEFRI